ncbi:hypothetical protein PIB30_010134 [Stylosanthes scabra]|uniref:R13L1/DRL21-like LRR repeat region domain-containing protein n=1 Tax=Stylosanthes scabra TaxID=79078 RepID=A0ABU6Z2G6_9FABA|nr:hypothetical protein [Stylosanthes scabra]
MQIVDLPNLKNLTAFVVDKKKQGQVLSVGELRKLPHLQGKVSIKNLQNVVEANEAIKANLMSKEKIEEIVFGWGETAEDLRIQKEVLEQLEPSKNLRRLTINFYERSLAKALKRTDSGDKVLERRGKPARSLRRSSP